MAKEDVKKLVDAVERARNTGDWGAYEGTRDHLLGESKPKASPKKAKKDTPEVEEAKKSGAFMRAEVKAEPEE